MSAFFESANEKRRRRKADASHFALSVESDAFPHFNGADYGSLESELHEGHGFRAQPLRHMAKAGAAHALTEDWTSTRISTNFGV